MFSAIICVPFERRWPMKLRTGPTPFVNARLTSNCLNAEVNLALTNGVGTVRNFMGQRLSNGTQMIALNIYNTAFARDMYGYAQAKAILFFIILACVSLIQVRISNKREVEM